MNQRGNVLFLILIAVALFAALSYAVTSSTRSGNNNSKSETISAQAAAIIQFLEAVDIAVLRMKMNGIAIENIDLGYPLKTSDGTQITTANSNCTSDTCRVFKPAGGNVSPVTFENYAVPNPSSFAPTSVAPGYYDYIMYQWPDAGTSAQDVVLRIRALEPEFCAEINKKLDITLAPNFSGSVLNGLNPASWDGGGYSCTTNCSSASGNKTFANVTSNYCNVHHLVIVR